MPRACRGCGVFGGRGGGPFGFGRYKKGLIPPGVGVLQVHLPCAPRPPQAPPLGVLGGPLRNKDLGQAAAEAARVLGEGLALPGWVQPASFRLSPHLGGRVYHSPAWRGRDTRDPAHTRSSRSGRICLLASAGGSWGPGAAAMR